jgi:hypothetical protein
MVSQATKPSRKTDLFPILSLVVLFHLSVCCQASLGRSNTGRHFGGRKPTNPLFRTKSNLLFQFRGGQQQPDPYTANTNTNANTQSQPYNHANYDQSTPQTNNYENEFSNYDQSAPHNHEDGFANVNSGLGEQDQLFHETVQERVDKWRSAQLEQRESYTAAQAANPRDEQGRLKLMSTVGKGSRAFIFFVLMWRDIHLLETADQNFKGALRLLTVIPLTALFIGNLGGVVGSLASPGHAAKKRLKAILNLDKLVEILLLAVYFIRLTIFPSKYIPRELYITGTLHSFLFLIQCQAYTRVSW